MEAFHVLNGFCKITNMKAQLREAFTN